MRILVNGIGNIGTTLLNLLVDYQTVLGISAIYANKRTLMHWHLADLKILESKGVIICCHQSNSHVFASHFPNHAIYEEIIEQIDYIFETSANHVGNTLKPHYQKLTHLKGVSAQGSEKGFGIPFMTGINESKIIGQKFVQIVSCNTHASLATLKTFSNAALSNLVQCDFVVVRRSEDLENHQRLVAASVVARHLDPDIGTHHAIDALDVLKTLGLNPQITSSDVTTPSQLLHTFRFNITLDKPTDLETVYQQINQNPLIATTHKFDSNKVFELGRKYSPYGRLYAQAIFVQNNIMIKHNQIMGWAFIPQEGNTLLSTLHAFLLQTGQKDHQSCFNNIASQLILKEV